MLKVFIALKGSGLTVNLSEECILFKSTTEKDVDVHFIDFRVCNLDEDGNEHLLNLVNYINKGVGGDDGLMKPFMEEVKPCENYERLLLDPALMSPTEKALVMFELGTLLENKSC